MNSTFPRSVENPAPGTHIATIAHESLLWDVYLDFESDPLRPVSFRARLRFEPPPGTEGAAATQTTVIIIEDSYDDAVAKAHQFDDRQLKGLLRSTLPEIE
jgi:hypothetical protein